MKLCVCDRPSRNPDVRDRRRCQCGGWTPTTKNIASDHLEVVAAKAARLLRHCVDEHYWAVHYSSTQGASTGVRSSQVSDPTANTATDPRIGVVGSWRRLAASFIIEALNALELADAALGEARYAVDPGPRDHVKAAEHDTFPHWEARRDIREAHEAKARRQARGEDWGAA